jgi:UDP-glucose 4-epimerase
VAEDHPVVPPDANAIHKWAGEQAWLLEHRVHGRHVAALRLSNCYGPGLRIRDAKQTFLGIWIRRVLEGAPFEVWGGEQLRDLTFAEDVANAFLCAAANPTCAGRALNLAGSAPISLNDLARMLVQVHGLGRFEIRPFPADRAAIDVGSLVLDDSAFRAATGWVPATPLEEGLRRTLAWYAPRLPLYLQDTPT